MYKAGYDSVTGFKIIMLGAGIGVLASTVNPFETGVASTVAGIGLGQGIIGRALLFVILLIVAILYTMKYAKKVKADSTKSIVYDLKKEHDKAF